MKRGRGEVHLRPFQGDKLGRPEPMPEGHQDHRGVAVTVAIALGGFDKSFDFGRGKVFTGAKFGVRPPQRANCPINGCR
jgi:hypothetical protein